MLKNLTFAASAALIGTLFAATSGLTVAHENTTAGKPASSSTAPRDKTEAAVYTIVEQLHTAINTGDVKLVERTLAPNVQLFEQGHRESSRAEYLSHHFKEDVAFAKAVPSKTTAKEIQVEGSIAVVIAESTTEGMYKDKPVKGANLSTYVLRVENGEWRIVHIHWSSRKRP